MSATSDAGRSGRQRFANVGLTEGLRFSPAHGWSSGGEGDIRSTRYRAQSVTAVEAPRCLAFAGPMGTSAARWGMELEPMDDRQTEAKMWVEVDLEGVMRAIPGRVLEGRIRRVMDREMAAIKAAVEFPDAGRLGFLDGAGRRAHPLKAHGQ